MGNETHEKSDHQERPAERQTEHVKRAQGEVTNAAESYTEHVKAHRIEKKLSGNSGATGQLPDKDGKGLASAKDLLGDDAHGLSKKEKQAALLAQIERDGYIVGKAQDKPVLVAEKPETKEKKIPKDGEPPITLKQLLNDYKTPFIDAYERSRSLKEGEPGKSKALEDIVDRMKACPWVDQIRVNFDSKAKNPEYDPVGSTITINPKDKPDAQVQLFAHEAYHSTHQFLNKMYSGVGPLDKQSFTDTLLWGEVGSMVAEAKVHQELKLGTEEPKFFFKNAQGVDDHIDIAPYVKTHGIKGLFDFLKTAQPVRKEQEPYGIYYQKNYQPYADHFQGNKPAAMKIVQQWVKAGHRAEDI